MSKILIDEATVKLVLEVLEHLQPTALTSFYTIGDRDKAITALKALAEQPAPLTWTFEDGLRPQDIRVEMYPPQPTSGMVVGMSKGVRLIHVPTGTTVSCDTERSQHRNREVAMKKLKAALAEQPAQQEFVSPGGGYVPAILAQQRPIKTFHGGKAWPVQEPAQQEPVAMRMPKVGDEVICIEDESLGMVAYLTAGGSPEIRFDDGSHGTYVLREFAELFRYTTPQPAQRKPLTADQIRGIYEECDAPTFGLFTIAFARAIEAAHGIKENT